MAAMFLGGCKTATKANLTTATPAASKEWAIRLNCYGPLYQLLGQEKNLDKLLFIKLESDELEAIVESIENASSESADRLEQFAKTDPRIDLQRLLLPPGEVAVRDAICKTKKDALLEPFNPPFEIELLRTQTEALSYAWHLAGVTAESEPHAKRKAWLKSFSAQMKQLHDQTLELLLARMNS
jgi:hypothetical protein